MLNLPSDPIILFSYVNTKLRDEYPSLEAMCDDLNISPAEIIDKLAAAGFEYSPEQNRFM